MKIFEKRKKVGVVAIDRSGSRSNFPYAVASVYSDKVGNFERVVDEVRKKLRMRHEYIKGKDFKPNQYKKAIQIIKGGRIDFFVYIVLRKVYDEIKDAVKWRKDWEVVLEARLWCKSTELLIEKSKKVPSEGLYETTYTDVNEKIFDDSIRNLFKEKLNLDNIASGSKNSPYIMIADWIAHFMHKDQKLRKDTTANLRFCRPENFSKDLKTAKIKNSPSSRTAPGTTGTPVNDPDNSMMARPLFKAFVLLRIHRLEISIWKSNTGSRLVGGTAAGPRNDQTINKGFSRNMKISILEKDLKITIKGPPHLTGILWSNDSETLDNMSFSPFPRLNFLTGW